MVDLPRIPPLWVSLPQAKIICREDYDQSPSKIQIDQECSIKILNLTTNLVVRNHNQNLFPRVTRRRLSRLCQEERYATTSRVMQRISLSKLFLTRTYLKHSKSNLNPIVSHQWCQILIRTNSWGIKKTKQMVYRLKMNSSLQFLMRYYSYHRSPTTI